MLESKEFIKGTNDSLFKTLIMHPKFRNTLIEILDEFTDLDKSKLQKYMVFLNQELSKEKHNERKKITYALLGIQNDLVNIECNTSNDDGTILKNNAYHHKLAYEKISVSGKYTKDKVYQINFNSKNRYQTDELIQVFDINDGKAKDEESFKRYIINLENFRKKYYTDNELTRAEKAMVILTATTLEEIHVIAKGDEELLAMEEIISDYNQDGKRIGLYDKEKWDKIVMEANMHSSHEKGLSQGLSQGLEQGLEQGRSEEKNSIARQLKSMGMKISEIAKATGLSENNVKKAIEN